MRAPSTVDVKTVSHRPKCSLYAVSLGGAGSAPRILAKVAARGDGRSSAGRADGRRPRLRFAPLSPQELTALEYEGLSAIRAHFGTTDPHFGVVRPLEHLPAESTILMDYVDAGTLRQKLIADSRLMPTVRSARSGIPAAGVWRKPEAG